MESHNDLRIEMRRGLIGKEQAHAPPLQKIRQIHIILLLSQSATKPGANLSQDDEWYEEPFAAANDIDGDWVASHEV